jgi:RNA polymerase sigma-70 factor (ECF subfamily)
MKPGKPQNHDPSTWVDEHGDALYRFALLRVKDPSVAEDLVQETFLAALKGLDGFKAGSSIRTWMVGILKHKIIDRFRRAKPEVLAADLASMENETETDRLDRADHRHEAPSVWHSDPDKLLDNKEFWKVLVACLDGLPETHRRAFSLREIDGLSGNEICKILSITSTNLWVILHRARGKLRNCLDNNWFNAK